MSTIPYLFIPIAAFIFVHLATIRPDPASELADDSASSAGYAAHREASLEQQSHNIELQKEGG
jgi:hypothetical protein